MTRFSLGFLLFCAQIGAFVLFALLWFLDASANPLYIPVAISLGIAGVRQWGKGYHSVRVRNRPRR